MEYVAISICLIIIIIIAIIVVKKKNTVKPIDIEKIEEKTPLEEVIEALEGTPERKLTTYEQDQEENAIISYQELVRAVEEKKSKTTPVSTPVIEPVVNSVETPSLELSDILEENITTANEVIENTVLEVDTYIEEQPLIDETAVIEALAENSEEEKKFKSSEFISPIFGKDKLTDEFLKELKDFRSNL